MARMTLPPGMAIPLTTATPAVESSTYPPGVMGRGRQGRECLDADADAPAERHDRGGERHNLQLAPDHRVRTPIASARRGFAAVSTPRCDLRASGYGHTRRARARPARVRRRRRRWRNAHLAGRQSRAIRSGQIRGQLSHQAAGGVPGSALGTATWGTRPLVCRAALPQAAAAWRTRLGVKGGATTGARTVRSARCFRARLAFVGSCCWPGYRT